MRGQFVDISSHQDTNIDWNAYKAWAAAGDGTARVSLRSDEGTGTPDANYKTFLAGARAAGVQIVIHYHYAYPQFNSAQAEADQMAAIVGSIPPTDVLMLDMEENVTSGTDADWAYSFLVALQKHYPTNLIVLYASRSYVANRLQDSRLTVWPLILADWNTYPDLPPQASPWNALYAWQFSDALTVPGFAAPVDANYYVGQFDPRNVAFNATPVSEFQPGFTEFGCGPFSVAVASAGVPAGNTSSQIANSSWAYGEYAKVNGDAGPGNSMGSSIPNMETFLADAKLDYLEFTPSYNAIVSWLQRGYPVIVTVTEAGVYDKDLGGNPYWWGAAGSHVLCIVGLDTNGDYLFFDTANVIMGDGNLQTPKTPRPWPRRYVASQIVYTGYAAAVRLPWMEPIPGGVSVGVPQGWSDDGTRLHNPANSFVFVMGFRNKVLNAASWPSWDVPLENEEGISTGSIEEGNPSIGPGSRQIHTSGEFGWTSTRGAYDVWAGQELLAVRKDRDAKAAALASAQAQVATLTAELASCAGGVPNLPDILSKLQALDATVKQADANLQTVIAAVQADIH